ncbi:phage holin [Fictibacillus sp. NRS-1165]|uniref:phage holin n=1 Tax=Fictibacillus sp. NRS-1165 TaxID=3144463 RepID=UPI003D24F97C
MIPSVDTTEDKIRFIIAMLAAIKVFIGTLGYNFFTDEQLVALENLIPFGFVIYATWKNNYITKKGEKQKAILKRNNLV